VGARTSVGLKAKHTAFLLRCGAAGFHEAPLIDSEDEPVTIGSVPTLDPLLVGADRVRRLAEAALDEALEELGAHVAGARLRVVLGLDEHLGRKTGPAQPTQADLLAGEIREVLVKRGAAAVTVEAVPRGEASAGLRLQAACDELSGRGVDLVLLGGAHSDYDPEIIQRLSALGRLFGAGNVNGVIPGESAAFVVLATPSFAGQRDLAPRALLHAIGTGFEKAGPDNDHPASEALGITQAVRTATGAMESEKLRAGWILTDMTAEVHRVFEWQTAFVRAQRFLCHPQWIDAPAQKLGRLGAAALPVQIAIAATAWRYGFGPHSRALSMVGSDSGERVATLWSDAGDGKGVQVPLEAPPPG
jgi:3-oxoacyl-[acyl-carrier-protein] synthase-1